MQSRSVKSGGWGLGFWTTPKNQSFTLLSAYTNSFCFVRRVTFQEWGTFQIWPPISMDIIFLTFWVCFSFFSKAWVFFSLLSCVFAPKKNPEISRPWKFHFLQNLRPSKLKMDQILHPWNSKMLQKSLFSHWNLDFAPKKRPKFFGRLRRPRCFSYVRGILENPNSYPHDILKTPKSYVRKHTRGGKKKLTP